MIGVAAVLAFEAVPFYTDWLWFEEVGYLSVFLRIAATRGSILIGARARDLPVPHRNLEPPSAPGLLTCSGSSRSRSGCPAAWCWSRCSSG